MAKKKAKKKAGKKAKRSAKRSSRPKARKQTSAKRARKPAAKRPAKPAAAARSRPSSWFDEAAQAPIIDRYARQLGSFMGAMADGVIDDAELKAQEGRLVQLMKDVESKLDDNVHKKVTQLLCELTAYDIMQMLHAMHAQRPQTVFQG